MKLLQNANNLQYNNHLYFAPIVSMIADKVFTSQI